MKKFLLYALFFIVFTSYVNANLIHINEVMFNPSGNDNNKEFVEITGTNNLSSYFIGDIVSNDSLELIHYCHECNFSLIVEEGFNYSDINCSIYSVGTTIGNGLSNEEDAIFIYNNVSLLEGVYFGGGLEGYSYSYDGLSWDYSQEVGGTPCAVNFVNNGTINQTINTSINITTNVTVNNSETCNISLNLRLKENKTIFNNGDAIQFYNDISDSSYDYVISYWIDDYFNNTLKTLVETKNTNKKQWTANINDRYEFAVIRNKLTFVNCSNINNETGSEIQVFIVSAGESSFVQDKDSSVEFDNAKISGNYVSVSGELYKGDTTKTVFSIRFQCEKENGKYQKSQELKTYLTDKFSSQKFSYKFSIKEILDVCYSDAEIIYSGLGIEGKADVEGFVRQEIASAELVDKENSIQKIVSNNSLVTTQTFNEINGKEVFVDEHFRNISDGMFNDKESNLEFNVSQKITGSVIQEKIEIKDSATSFVNLLVVVLILFLIVLVFFKKW